MRDGESRDAVRLGDRRDGVFYRHDERIRLALKVALITNRPLLLVGPPGCGKSSLAPYVARNLGMRYLSYGVTETAEASDLLWRMDYVRRLNDAQIHQIKPTVEYVDRGVLWRAFEATSEEKGCGGTLVLIDEIDKANSSFANSLLVALGSLEFDVPPLGGRIIKADPDAIILVIMTSNGERELPPALTRRCITLRVNYPSAADLVEIAAKLWPKGMEDSLFRSGVESLAESLTNQDLTGARISTAEFVDLVQVLRVGCVKPSSAAWKMVEGLVLYENNEDQ